MPDADHRTCQLAIDAHRARADQQEARAVAAEEVLAAFARNVEEHARLAEQAAQGQRDSDVLKEIRRRIPPLERQAGRGRAAEAKLTAITVACRSIPTPIAERILAIISSEEEARDA